MFSVEVTETEKKVVLSSFLEESSKELTTSSIDLVFHVLLVNSGGGRTAPVGGQSANKHLERTARASIEDMRRMLKLGVEC